MIKNPFILGYGGLDSSQFRAVAERLQRERQDKFITTVDAVARATGQKIDATALAEKICRAAAKARGELPPEPQKLSPMAQAILRAAAKARGEIVDPPQELSPMARAVINAGRRRRNEPEL
jgi:hypothetical protein